MECHQLASEEGRLAYKLCVRLSVFSSAPHYTYNNKYFRFYLIPCVYVISTCLILPTVNIYQWIPLVQFLFSPLTRSVVGDTLKEGGSNHWLQLSFYFYKKYLLTIVRYFHLIKQYHEGIEDLLSICLIIVRKLLSINRLLNHYQIRLLLLLQ